MFHPEINSFEQLELKTTVLRGILAYGFERPSAIQRKAIIPFLKGKDIVAQAQSGTGKTATFSISLLEIMNENSDDLQTVILSPTRELAQQTYIIIKELGKYTKFEYVLCVGGTNRRDNISEIKKRQPHCIIGTPGRIEDLARDSHIDLIKLKALVLDEADELLSNTFEDQIKDIINLIGEKTQIGLYSATMPPKALELANNFLREPENILVKNEELTLEGISQYYVFVAQDAWKYDILKDLYGAIAIYQLMIYCNSKKRVDYLAEQLEKDGYTYSCSHGEMAPEERLETMQKFRTGENRILITTDLLSRGIDVQQVSLVINYDIPYDLSSYIHRIGRSGRYGRKGIALNFINKKEETQLRKIEDYYQTQIKELPHDIENVFKKL